MLMSIGKFAKEIGVSVYTLRNWDKSGKLKPVKIADSGFRYYSKDQVLEYLNKPKEVKKDKINILYARVSTKSQKDDLDRQVENLKQYAYSKGYSFEVITDIASGINYQRKGLKKLLKLINYRQIDRIVVLYKDRLVRFGFELIEELCELNEIKIEIIDNTRESKEEELTNDLIQITTVFADKLYGSRSKKTKKLLEEIKNDSN